MANEIQPFMADESGQEGPAYAYVLHSPQAWCLGPDNPWLRVRHFNYLSFHPSSFSSMIYN